jgi:hypothetical protein
METLVKQEDAISIARKTYNRKSLDFTVTDPSRSELLFFTDRYARLQEKRTGYVYCWRVVFTRYGSDMLEYDTCDVYIDARTGEAVFVSD